MPATASVRSKFYSKQDMIADSASPYYEELAEQAKEVADANDRNCIIDGKHPRTGEALDLAEHARCLKAIEANDEEWHVYNMRVRQQEALLREADDELHDMINSQYPCTCCDERLGMSPVSAVRAPRPTIDWA